MLKVCQRHIQVEKEQAVSVWESVLVQQVPFKPKEFVLVVLWHKFLVAQRLV